MIIETNKTYTFKLVSGEEFVAKITEIHADYYMISQPISTVISPQGLQMVPSLFSANLDGDVRLNISSYSMVAEPREDVADSYRQATTGITVPARKQIITG